MIVVVKSIFIEKARELDSITSLFESHLGKEDDLENLFYFKTIICIIYKLVNL